MVSVNGIRVFLYVILVSRLVANALPTVLSAGNFLLVAVCSSDIGPERSPHPLHAAHSCRRPA